MAKLLLIFLLSSSIFTEPIVELTVNERFGQARNNEPVTSGVPLPSGLITNVSSLALTDEAGNKINCEFRKVSEWHNNTSIKWVHLDFQTSLPESGSVKYVLHNDPSKNAVTGSTLSATDRGSRIEVNTGKIRFFVKKANYNIIDEALIGTDTVIAPHDRGLALKIGTNEYLSSSDASSTTTIERKGDMSVCIKSEGYLKMGTASVGLYFVSRIYAYNNSPVIKYVLSYELHKATVNDSIVVKSLFIDLPTRLTNATATLGAPTAPQSSVLSAGDTSYVVASNPFAIAMGANDAKVYYRFGGKATGTGDAMVSSNHFRDKTLGWGSLSNGSKGFAFSFRDYWQQNPKSLELYGTGLCRIGVYPEMRNGEYTDLKWYSGMARTVEMRFALLTNENSNEVKALVHGMQRPLLAIAPPSWYCSDTRAFGLLVEKDTSKIQKTYQTYARIMDSRFTSSIMTHLDYMDRMSKVNVAMDCYGFFEWGNIYHYADDDGVYLPINLKWEGNYYGLDHTHFIQFIRTGDFRFFDFFEITCRGNMDTHVGNFGPVWASKVGACRYCPSNHFVFNESRVLNISAECNHHKNDGMFERFYLCGDERSIDQGMKTVQWAVTAWSNGYSMPGQIRGPGAYMWMLLQAYHYTKQTSYLDKLAKTVGYHNSRAPGSMSQFDWMGPLYMEGVILYDQLQPTTATQTFIKTVASWATGYKNPAWALTAGYCYSLTKNETYLTQLKDHVAISAPISNLYKDFSQSYRSTNYGIYYFSKNPVLVSTEKVKGTDGAFDKMSCSPNPCNPATTITLYSPSMNENSSVNIFNGAGQLVKSFSLNAENKEYERTVSWDGTSSSGKGVSSGIYVVKWTKGNRTLSQRLVLAR